jgi:hypothetical protein
VLKINTPNEQGQNEEKLLTINIIDNQNETHQRVQEANQMVKNNNNQEGFNIY